MTQWIIEEEIINNEIIYNEPTDSNKEDCFCRKYKVILAELNTKSQEFKLFLSYHVITQKGEIVWIG